MNKKHLTLYNRYYAERNFERTQLFQLLADYYQIQSALYPGSFTHVTPSFVFCITAYIDTDKRAKQFFTDPALNAFINKHKTYSENPTIRFHPTDYRHKINEQAQSFDLLISQYAGFVSQHCKCYLKRNGLLLVNNSHGDASMASLDDDYQFVAVVLHRHDEYKLSEKYLDHYFVPKSGTKVTRELLEKTQKGIGYTKSASAYIFSRTR